MGGAQTSFCMPLRVSFFAFDLEGVWGCPCPCVLRRHFHSDESNELGLGLGAENSSFGTGPSTCECLSLARHGEGNERTSSSR